MGCVEEMVMGVDVRFAEELKLWRQRPYSFADAREWTMHCSPKANLNIHHQLPCSCPRATNQHRTSKTLIHTAQNSSTALLSITELEF